MAPEEDLKYIPEPGRSEMKFFLAKTVEDVLEATLPRVARAVTV